MGAAGAGGGGEFDAVGAVEAAAPFVTDAGLLAAQVQFASPVNYKYAEGRSQAQTTQQNQMFQMRVPAADLAAAFAAMEGRLGEQPGYAVKVIRTFRPEPEVCTCRWEVTFKRKPYTVVVDGSSKYRFQEGKVTGIEETWETRKEGAKNQSQVSTGGRAGREAAG